MHQLAYFPVQVMRFAGVKSFQIGIQRIGTLGQLGFQRFFAAVQKAGNPLKQVRVLRFHAFAG